MGKGQIVSGGASGQYTVKILWDRARATDAIARLEAEIASIDALLPSLLAEVESLQIQYEAAKYAVSPATPFSELAALLSAINAKRARYDLYLVERASKDKRRQLLQSIPADANASAWCADLTENLTGDVGTIEPKGEPADYIIRPGHGGGAAYSAARDGQIQPILSGTPEGTFWNKAMMPGWQKWQPQYRIGTITAIDTGTDTCDLTLDAENSRERPRGQDLDINQGVDLEDVPIVYMTCNSRAFAIDDRVVVEFTDRDFTKPRVIGFEDHPKACKEYYVYIQTVTAGGTQYRSAMVWDIAGNCAAAGLGFTSPCDYDDEAFQAWWNARTKLQTETWFDSQTITQRYSTTIEPDVPLSPEQWEYSNHEESLHPWMLPEELEALEYGGGEDAEHDYHHTTPCSLSNGDADGLLDLNPTHDGYVQRFQSLTSDLDDITSTTNHVLINVYALPTGATGAELLTSRLIERTGSPVRRFWNRLRLEDLYNTNVTDGTHEKWIERYRTTFGELHVNEGYKQLHYTPKTDGSYTWGKYEYELTDWTVGYRKATNYYWTFTRNTAKSLVIVAILRGQIATEEYWWEEAHGEVERYESDHTITWQDRVFKVHACAVAADDITLAEIPGSNNATLSALIESCYAHAYTLAGITDPTANEYESAAQYIAK